MLSHTNNFVLLPGTESANDASSQPVLLRKRGAGGAASILHTREGGVNEEDYPGARGTRAGAGGTTLAETLEMLKIMTKFFWTQSTALYTPRVGVMFASSTLLERLPVRGAGTAEMKLSASVEVMNFSLLRENVDFAQLRRALPPSKHKIFNFCLA